jgi:hypothetical protein
MKTKKSRRDYRIIEVKSESMYNLTPNPSPCKARGIIGRSKSEK